MKQWYAREGSLDFYYTDNPPNYHEPMTNPIGPWTSWNEWYANFWQINPQPTFLRFHNTNSNTYYTEMPNIGELTRNYE